MDNSFVFLDVSHSDYIYETLHFFVIQDKYPVSPGHSLIISKKSKIDFFELDMDERIELMDVLKVTKAKIEERYKPDEYNIGMNCGAAAGQTVSHFHCHVIPRHIGDMNDPRGGVRHCVEGKGYYSN